MAPSARTIATLRIVAGDTAERVLAPAPAAAAGRRVRLLTAGPSRRLRAHAKRRDGAHGRRGPARTAAQDTTQAADSTTGSASGGAASGGATPAGASAGPT